MHSDDVPADAVPSGGPPRNEVDALLAVAEHPLSATVREVRAELLAVPGVIEGIKWKAPNYALSDDFATMSLRRPDVVQLILHTGAKPKPDHPEIVVGTLPAFARRADRNRVVLSFSEAALNEEDRSALRRLLTAWVAQLV
jgi:hypothetical protein